MGKDTNEHITKLGDTNYSDWVGEMHAILMTKEVWGLVKGEDTKPSDAEKEELKKWKTDQNIAAGQIFIALEPSQRVHVKGIEEDPVKMWASLESVHLQKCPSTRFNAMDALFSIRLQENKSLTSLITRIDGAMHRIQSLHPGTFTLADSDGETQVHGSYQGTS